jgi:hypothetical protein
MEFFFVFAIAYWVAIMTVGLWYELLRRKMKEHVLLPRDLARCSFRKIDIEIENLKQQGIADAYMTHLATVKKLYIAMWVTIALGPFGMLWILAFS